MSRNATVFFADSPTVQGILLLILGLIVGGGTHELGDAFAPEGSGL